MGDAGQGACIVQAFGGRLDFRTDVRRNPWRAAQRTGRGADRSAGLVRVFARAAIVAAVFLPGDVSSVVGDGVQAAASGGGLA
jgi:hypothetical protein